MPGPLFLRPLLCCDTYVLCKYGLSLKGNFSLQKQNSSAIETRCIMTNQYAALLQHRSLISDVPSVTVTLGKREGKGERDRLSSKLGVARGQEGKGTKRSWLIGWMSPSYCS